MKTEPPGFADFWSVWKAHQRKTDGRGKARPAYQQMIDAGHSPEDIIDGARWYLQCMKPEERPYIPLASSWLRAERFTDDCEQWRAYQQRKEAREHPVENVVQLQPTGKTDFLRKFEAMKRNE